MQLSLELLEEGEVRIVTKRGGKLHVGSAAHFDTVEQADARRRAVVRARRLYEVPCSIREQLPRQHKRGLRTHKPPFPLQP